MASSPSPGRPSSIELIELISGPRVDIYVGPKKKHYSLPKKLLCYYSKYFDRCFNGNFIEGQTQKLDLLEDKVEDFDIILEYMLHHGLTSEFKITFYDFESGFDQCMRFVEYVSKYDMGYVASLAVYKPLRSLVEDKSKRCRDTTFSIPVDDVETVFSLTPRDSELRTLMAQAVLSGGGVGGLKEYEEIIYEIKDFGFAVYKELYKSLQECTWNDPITGDERED